MGADNLVVYFGLRYEVASDDEFEQSLELRDDPRLAAALAPRI